jgi:L-aspartate oxidase
VIGVETDVLVIGCGIAGATAALQLAEDGQRQITVLTRDDDADSSNSRWAQGGIVGRGRDDSVELLVEDLVSAGAGLAFQPAVRVLAEEGPDLLQEILIQKAGVRFDHDEAGEVAFGLEGAHSRRRILHVGDITGEAIMAGLRRALARRPNIKLLTRHTAVDLLTFPHHSRDPLAVYRPTACHGTYALDHETGKVETITARWTILATGGLGQVYLNTTNPPGARGDGLAMAYRAGARVVNAEYVQFHPTALSMAGTTKTLISEAVRGEGGILLTPDGERFMERCAPVEKELATRDVVARAIYQEMIDHEHPYVLLDIASRKPAEVIRQRFPQIHALCLEHNIDISRQPIPVVPAAHYFCGGVLVDLWGRTTLPRLYAVGEVACSGVHGANRLASTSLLEGLVWGDRAARDIRERDEGEGIVPDDVPSWDETGLRDEADPALIQGDLHNIRSLMWHYVGLMRNGDRLSRAVRELRRLWFSIEDFYRRAHLTDGLVGLRNAVLNAVIVSRAALLNPTSRGCHYREDSRPRPGARPPDGSHPVEPVGGD